MHIHKVLIKMHFIHPTDWHAYAHAKELTTTSHQSLNCNHVWIHTHSSSYTYVVHCGVHDDLVKNISCDMIKSVDNEIISISCDVCMGLPILVQADHIRSYITDGPILVYGQNNNNN